MAASEPDVGLLTSSAQIFASNHTLPQIRAIHKALHVQVDDKAARLRTQVGGSYRELLGTADTIVQMRSDMEAVRATLAGMGSRCGRAVVSSKAAALAKFVGDTGDNTNKSERLGLAARARLLEACARTVGRLLSRGGGQMVAAQAKTRAKGQPTPRAAQGRGGRLVLAAKVLVLSRLVVTSLAETDGARAAAPGDEDATVRASIEASKRTLVRLRQRLREIVEAVEQTVHHASSTGGDEKDDLVQALCAYSLATTSGARDVLWQLLQVRSQAMAAAFIQDSEDDAITPDDVLRGLGLYTKTLLDLQALMPHRLPEALLGLKKRPLLDDASLQALEDLRLDVCARWCGEDVQFFKPYVRHDDVDAAQLRQLRSQWARRGATELLAGLERALVPGMDLAAMVDLRTRVLQLWIRDSSRARMEEEGDDEDETQDTLLDRLRAVFNRHLLQVLAAKVGKLRLVGSEAAAAVAAWRPGITDRHTGLWPDKADGEHDNDEHGDDHVAIDVDLSAGAVPFMRDVVARLHGRSDLVARAVASYTTWRHVVDEVAAAVDRLRKQRWENDADDMVEDEDTIAQRQQLLSRDDPALLQGRLQTGLTAAFADLDTQLVAVWADAQQKLPAHQGAIAMYLVRVLREIRSRRPCTAEAAATASTASTLTKATDSDAAPVATDFGLAIVPALHAEMVRCVAASPLDQFVAVVLARRTVAGRSLWELDGSGDSLLLPSTPSPGVFKFLRDLSAAMSHAGMDLWSPTAVGVLKRHVAAQLAERWAKTLKEMEEEKSEGGEKEEKEGEDGEKGDEKEKESEENKEETKEDNEKEEEPTKPSKDDQRRDLMLQWLLDVAWLRCSLGSSEPTAAQWIELENTMYERAGLAADAEGPAARKRMAKVARDYWKKTSLLFGVLV